MKKTLRGATVAVLDFGSLIDSHSSEAKVTGGGSIGFYNRYLFPSCETRKSRDTTLSNRYECLC